MNESLIPFDLSAAKADPMRVRHMDGRKPAKAEFFNDTLVVLWQNYRTPEVIYPEEFASHTRLAAKTRQLDCRVYRDRSGNCRLAAGICTGVVGGPFPGTEWLTPTSVCLIDDGLIEVTIVDPS